MRSCNSVKWEECRTDQNTHDTVLRQHFPLIHDGCIGPRTSRNDRSRWKASAECSLDPYAVLDEDEGIAMVNQRTQKIWSRYHIRKGPVNPSIFRKRQRTPLLLERADDKTVLSVCGLFS
jgi:hypothetical protein